MKVENMVSSNGNKVPNQFWITDNNADYFQSYKSMIAKREDGIITLDCNYWDYSVTTSKYRNKFLGRTSKEIKQGIKDGSLLLDNLN